MPDDWYHTFLKQARSLIKWLGHSEGSKDKTYLYARWGKGGKSEKVSTIPRDRRTDIGDWIFEQFNKTQKQLFGSGTGVKDSWNPMDVYIVKKSDEASIKDSILCCIKAEIAPDSRDAAEMEVSDSAGAIVNSLLGLTIEDSGRFIRWDGTDHPW